MGAHGTGTQKQAVERTGGACSQVEGVKQKRIVAESSSCKVLSLVGCGQVSGLHLRRTVRAVRAVRQSTGFVPGQAKRGRESWNKIARWNVS